MDLHEDMWRWNLEVIDVGENNVTILEALDHHAALRMLDFSRADIMLHYWGPITSDLKNYPVPGLKMKVVHKLEAYMIVSRKTPDAQNIMFSLTNAYKSLRQKGMMPDIAPPATVQIETKTQESIDASTANWHLVAKPS